MIPGQFGPRSRTLSPRSASRRRTFTMSRIGIPSVIAQTNAMPASAASMMASAANGGGTKMIDALAPVSRTACSTVWKIGTRPRNRVPPRPGVTPATSCVPYSSICSAWKLPAEPVMPWTRTRVFLSTKMDTWASP
jgi:hypothetical protein